MMDRRDLLFTGACAAALGASEWLRPRKTLKLLGSEKLTDIVPARIGKWHQVPGGGLVVPTTEGSLADRLYSDTLVRIYRSEDDVPPVMLLIAYGAAQSDLLQLHRPESCYPAIGFSISDRSLVDIPLGSGVKVPGVHLTATAQERVEDIAYWARLGEYLPQTAGDQRRDRLATAVQGYVADGVLVRASAIRDGASAPEYAMLDQFMASMLASLEPAKRAALIGSDRAKVMRSA